MESRNDMDLQWTVRIRLQRGGKIIFGTGVSQLLCLTGQHESLHKAAKEMGMSYRKALKIVKRAEEAFGKPLLRRSVGGDGGGGSQLTAFSRDYMERFQALQSQVEACTISLAKSCENKLW